MPNINRKAVEKELKLALKDFGKEAAAAAVKAFNKNKQKMLQDFRAHPVTKEIKGGPGASNDSNTLGGYGNLYSYIGFDKDAQDPTKIIEERLDAETKMSERPVFKTVGNESFFEFEVSTVNAGALEEITPMPFEPGKSWVRGIEKGISGLSYYIYGKLLNKSRSGTGVQADAKIRGLAYKPIKYMSEILDNFKRSFK